MHSVRKAGHGSRVSDLDALARPSRNRDQVQLLKALRRAGRIANYRVSIDDARGPDHDKTFIASAQIVALSGRLCSANGEHRRHKVAQDLAAAAVIDELRRQEPDQPLALQRPPRGHAHQHARRTVRDRGSMTMAAAARSG